jgi:hypothetical protein
MPSTCSTAGVEESLRHEVEVIEVEVINEQRNGHALVLERTGHDRSRQGLHEEDDRRDDERPSDDAAGGLEHQRDRRGADHQIRG